jgi:hypothetical protein
MLDSRLGTGLIATSVTTARRKQTQRLTYERTMTEFGKLLVFSGVVLIAAGLVLMLLGLTHLPIGRLPGDIFYRGKNTTVYFPLATSLLLSIVLSVVLYLINRFRR